MSAYGSKQPLIDMPGISPVSIKKAGLTGFFNGLSDLFNK